MAGRLRTRRPGIMLISMRSRLLVLLATVAVLGFGVEFAARRIATGPLRERIEQELSRSLGLAVSVGGLEAGIWPSPRLRAQKVVVANFPDRPSPQLLGIEDIELRLEIWPLLKRAIVVDALTVEAVELHLETNRDGRLGLDFGRSPQADEGGGDGFRLDLRDVRVGEVRAFYRDDQRGVSRSLVLDSLVIETEDAGSEIELAAHGRFEGSEIGASGRIGSLRELLEPSRPYPVDLSGQLFEARFRAQGSVRKPRTLEGLDLALSAAIPEVVVMGRPLPQLGELRFTGRLSDPDGRPGLADLHLSATRTDPVRLDVTGRIGDVLELADVDLDARVETGSLDFLAPLVQPRLDFPVPSVSSLSARGKLSDRDGGLRLDASVRAATPGDAIAVKAQGSIVRGTPAPAVDATFEVRADDLTSVTALFRGAPGSEPLGPVSATGRLRSHDGVLGAEGIVARLGSREKVWAELEGSIADLVGLHGVALDLTFGAASLHHLAGLLARELPRTSAFAGSAALSDADGSLGLEHLKLHGGQGSPVEIHLDARLDDLPRRDDIEVELGLRCQDAHVLGAIAGVDLPPTAPVELRGTIHGSDENLEVDDLLVRLGETRLLGRLSGAFTPQARPALKAQLASKDVRLEDLGIRPAEEAAASSRSSGASRRLDGAVALPFEDLRRVDLDLGLQIDHVGGAEGFDTRDLVLRLQLDDGDLRVTNLGATYQSGHVSGALRADARTPVPELTVDLETRGMNLAKLVSQFRQGTDYSGIVDGELDLRARGATFDALRQSVAGRVGVAVRDGDAVSRVAREFVVDLATAVFPGIRTRQVPSIGCGIAHLEIENGLATIHTLFLREKELSVNGTGRIDLAHGTYDLLFVPSTTHPGIVSVAPEVEVTGPLDDPRFRPVKRTLLTSFGRGLLQNAINLGGTLIRPLAPRPAAVEEHEAECRLASFDPP